MSGKQFIKFCPVAPRHSRRVGDVAFGDLQQLTQIVEFKLITRLNKGWQRRVLPSSACSTSASLITGDDVSATHCSITLTNWRTLPGQLAVIRRFIASVENARTNGLCRSAAAQQVICQ